MKIKVSIKDARSKEGTIADTRAKAIYCREKRKPRLYKYYVEKLDKLMQTSITIEE